MLTVAFSWFTLSQKCVYKFFKRFAEGIDDDKCPGGENIEVVKKMISEKR